MSYTSGPVLGFPLILLFSAALELPSVGFIFSFQAHHREHIRSSPVEVVLSCPQVLYLQDSREVRNIDSLSSFCYTATHCWQSPGSVGRGSLCYDLTLALGSCSPLYLISVGLVGSVAGACVGLQMKGISGLWLI